MMTVSNQGLYLTFKQVAEQQGCSERHIRDEVNEMKKLIGDRYEPEDFLDDEKKVNQYALWDYQKYRKSLKAGLRVPKFDRLRWAEVCPIVERWRI